jgi:DNA (cytosine-5)-methyltransferase 1
LNAFDNTGDSRATVLIVFDNSYRDGLRIQKGNTVNTLSAKMGTGGNNVPMLAQDVPVLMRGREGKPGGGKGPLLSENMSLTLAGGNDQVLFEPVIAFDGYNQSTTEDIYRALRIGIDSGDCIAIPIQDGREMEKKQNGLGIGQEGDPSYTLDQTGAQSVAAEQGEESTMQVRRLTPIECERLMGWADNHTLHRADSKQNADTTRYKMCGNGVASPVAQWIGQHLMAIMNDE